MTPGETASEKKRSRSYWGFGLIGAVVIVAVALIFWPRAGGEQPLSLTVLGHSTNYWDYPVNGHFRLVFAYVAVTNSTKETLVLGSDRPTRCCVLLKGKSGWSPEPFGSHFFFYSTPPPKLLPGESFMFGAGIPRDTLCKVGVNYLNDRLSARIWQKLPPWLTKKLSWASPWRTATTEVIDLSRL